MGIGPSSWTRTARTTRATRSTRSARAASRAASCAAAVAAVALLAGCAPLEPWVKPYERERLADPIMKFSRNALADKHSEHVRDVREAAHGATGVQGGGCGCK